MKQRIIYVLQIILIFLLFLSNIYLLIQNKKLKKSFDDLSDKTTEAMSNYEKILLQRTELMSFKIDSINEKIHMLIENQNSNSKEIQESLSSMKKKTDNQFNQTVGMKESVDHLLEEQKKKTINTIEKDTETTKIKNNANILYQQRNYSASYEEYKKVLELRNDDNDSRLNKMKSLYFKNPSDTSSYYEIMEDIKILKQNGKADDECLEIEKIISTEIGGIHE